MLDPDDVADRVHQMGFAQADAAVDEQRVVSAARILRDLIGRRARQLVALAFDEIGEGEIRIQPAAEHRGRFAGGAGAAIVLDGHGRSQGTGRGARTYFQHDRRSRLGAHGIDQLGNPAGHIFVDPVDHEPIRREQTQDAAVLDRLQRPDPRVELLLRQFGFQLPETAMP